MVLFNEKQLKKWPNSDGSHDCMDAGARATQEQLPVRQFVLGQAPCSEEPSLILFASDKRPLFINLAEQLHPGVLERQTCYSLGRELFKWLMTDVGLISRTQPVSLTPEPFITISTTPGLLAL